MIVARADRPVIAEPPRLRPLNGDPVACHLAESLPPMTDKETGPGSAALARRLEVLAETRRITA